MPVSPGVDTYVVGDRWSWWETLAHDFDVFRRRSAIRELRAMMLERILSYDGRASMDDSRRGLLVRLSVALRRSDEALLQSTGLVGLTARNGLFEKIEELVGQEE